MKSAKTTSTLNRHTAPLSNRTQVAERVLAVLSVTLFILVLLSFILPLLSAISPLAGGMFSPASQNKEKLSVDIASLLKITWFTFKEALVSTFIALLLGIPAAFLVAKKDFLGRRLLIASASVPLCIPALIVALGYVGTFGMAGYANELLMKIFHLSEPPLTFLYSFWGIVITQGFYNFPLVMATVADCWSELPPEQAENARLLGASEARIFRTITWYQLLPSIVSACIPVFLYCFFSFMIVLLFGATGCTTLEVAVYHSARSTLDFENAAFLALIETTAAFIMVFIYGKIENSASRSRGISFSSEKQKRMKLSKKEMIPFLIFFIIILLFFFAPLASIAIASLPSWKKLFSLNGFFPALRTTFTTALATALLCTVTAFVYALFLRIKDPFAQHTFLRSIPLLPMAVSSVVMGLGMTLLVKHGTPIALVFAQAALSWPFAFRQVYTPLAKMPDNVLDAARILSPHKLDGVFRVCIPYSTKGLVSAFGFCFAISAGDATLPLVLAIPDFDTLALFTYRLAGSHRFSQASASGLLLGLLCALVFSLSNKLKDR